MLIQVFISAIFMLLGMALLWPAQWLLQLSFAISLQKGDKLMTEIFNKWQDHILAGSIGLTNLFDPDCIVLSGSMAQFVDTDYLEQKTNEEIIVQPTKVLKATAGNYAGMIGAGLLALGAING